MFDRQYRVYSHLLLVADLAVGVPALFLAYFLRSHADELIPFGVAGLFDGLRLASLCQNLDRLAALGSSCPSDGFG